MRKTSTGGFTLMELLVVLAIISIAMTVVWPRLPRIASAERSGALARLAASETALFEYAAFKKKALPSSTSLKRTSTGPV